MLKQKAVEYDTAIYEVSRFFPSSKLCPCCGNLKNDLKLSDRIYSCDCGYTQDRDINASINLRNEFLKNSSVEYTDYKHGETIRPKRIGYNLSGSFSEVFINELEKCA
jgi:transposase